MPSSMICWYSFEFSFALQKIIRFFSISSDYSLYCNHHCMFCNFQRIIFAKSGIYIELGIRHEKTFFPVWDNTYTFRNTFFCISFSFANDFSIIDEIRPNISSHLHTIFIKFKLFWISLVVFLRCFIDSVRIFLSSLWVNFCLQPNFAYLEILLF